jgi:hypothetical protein
MREEFPREEVDLTKKREEYLRRIGKENILHQARTPEDGITPADQGTTCNSSEAQTPESGNVTSGIELIR